MVYCFVGLLDHGKKKKWSKFSLGFECPFFIGAVSFKMHRMGMPNRIFHLSRSRFLCLEGEIGSWIDLQRLPSEFFLSIMVKNHLIHVKKVLLWNILFFRTNELFVLLEFSPFCDNFVGWYCFMSARFKWSSSFFK